MLIGIDIGTSSSKGVLVGPDGTVAAQETRPHGVATPKPGWVEHDAVDVWWADFVAIARSLVAAADGRRITGLGVSGIGPCLLPADADGHPLRPAILYGVDTRATEEIDLLTAKFGAEAILARGGTPLSTQAIAPELRLPELFWPNEVVGTITASAAAATGLPAGLPVTAGTVDAWAEATSVGVSSPGDVMVMYGTTMFVIQVIDAPNPHPSLWTTRGVVPDTYSLAAGMATSGAVTDWLRQLFQGSFAALVSAAESVPAGSRGLLMLPYFAGERTPIFDPDARGILAGLTLSHGQAEIYRAALEGTAYGLRHNLEVMASAGGTPARLVAVGGGTQGGLWTQIVSDVTGTDQQLPSETIGAAYGSARLAAMATGVPADNWNPIARTVTPNPANTATYSDFYEHYRSLYPATQDLVHFLAAQQHQS